MSTEQRPDVPEPSDLLTNKKKKVRAVCFTCNNWTETDISVLEAVGKSIEDDVGNTVGGPGFFSLRYLVFQKEVGEHTGTPHIQGYANATQGKQYTYDKWISILGPRISIRSAKGSPQQNQRYCTKFETRVTGTLSYEYGSCPSQGARGDLAAIFEAARNPDLPWTDVIETDPDTFIKYSNGIQRIRAAYVKPRLEAPEVYWLYGPTGTGKTKWAFEQSPEAYWKPGGTKWWDGYTGNEDVIIDDYRCDLCTFSTLLRLLDRYPIRGEFKGGFIHLAPRRIYITTPKDPVNTWAGRTAEDLQQLLRRITHIIEYTSLGAEPIQRQPGELVVRARVDGFNSGDSDDDVNHHSGSRR